MIDRSIRCSAAALVLFAVAMGSVTDANAQATSLFFSEYLEGSSNNKALEIYNGTGVPVNTTGCVAELYSNGATTITNSLVLTATIADGDVYVIANASASAPILAIADITSAVTNYNGDDAVALRCGGALVDVIGVIGTDPGTQWGTPPTSTLNQTLRRKGTVCQGDANGSDAFDPAIEWDGFAIDDIVNLGAHSSTCGSGGVTLAVNDIAAIETDAGTTTFTFTVSLNAPADAGGVSFDIATADGTATTADNDYVQRSLAGQTIPAGNSSYTFDVTVNGDLTNEPNETYFVNVTNVTGATVGDGQGLGTINNDDFPLVPIHDIQGIGAASPLLGNVVTTRGVVTSRVNNGFYIQARDADVDADPGTSEGMLVFTSSAPPAAAVSGNFVQVTGTVTEFVPATDPNTQPQTELTTPTVILLSTGQPLPAPIALTTTLPDPAGGVEQLERLEHMRVSIASVTISGATGGNTSEPNATSTSNGRFYGVVTGLPRPFRQPGVEPEDGVGLPGTIPRWDGNPERINFESLRARDGAGILRPTIDLDAGATLTGVTGVLDYAFRNPRVTIDFDAAPVVAGGQTAIAVTPPTPAEFTIATYNFERFFDTVDDPGISDPVLTATAFANRLAKASTGIRDYLRTPDIIGAVEIENLATLQAIADRVNADAITNAQPNPLYQAYLVEGQDPGGIDVGFLVKTAAIAATTPRVAVGSVTQFGLTTIARCPDGQDASNGERLNDRPPLLLVATVNSPNGASASVTVVVNHLRSLIGVASNAAPPVGQCAGVNFTSAGDRVRRKRQQQAVFLADLVQARQVANPNENIVLVGDFNAFEFNDGLGDSMGVIAGTPAPDNQTLVPDDGIDLVDPDLANLNSTVPAPERYSFVFDGDAQNLDHVLVNAPIVTDAAPVRLEHARINADFSEDNRGDTSVPLRLADHDPAVAYFSPPGFGLPDDLFRDGFEDPPSP